MLSTSTGHQQESKELGGGGTPAESWAKGHVSLAARVCSILFTSGVQQGAQVQGGCTGMCHRQHSKCGDVQNIQPLHQHLLSAWPGPASVLGQGLQLGMKAPCHSRGADGLFRKAEMKVRGPAELTGEKAKNQTDREENDDGKKKYPPPQLVGF